MSRSFVSCTLIVLMSGIGCVAQEPGKGLQESIARLEEQVARLGEHMKSVQEGQLRKKDEQAHALDEREAAMQKMRAEIVNHERAWQERQLDQERTIAELKQAMAQQREQMTAEHAKARDQFERELRQRSEASAQERERKAHDEAEHLRAELVDLREHSGPRDGDRSAALELLAAERKQIEQLREQVVAELEKTEQGAAASERLRDENQRLRDRVSALERELARSRQERAAAPPPAPAPASVVINNEDGEIHLHFHGPAPNVSMPAVTPPRAADATPGPAGPSGPSRARSRDGAPRKEAPTETKDRDDADEKRLNYVRPAAKSAFVEVLSGSF